MASDAELRASIARAQPLSGLDRIQFPGNPQATRAIEQIVALLTARFGSRSPFMDRVPTWGELGRFGFAGFRTPSGTILPPPVPPTAGADPVPFNVFSQSEGLWEPVDASGAGLSFTVGDARWLRVGRMVMAWFDLAYPSTANGSNALIGGLPFPASGQHPVSIAYTNASTLVRGATFGDEMALYQASGAAVTNATLSGLIVRAQVIYVPA